jgi:hypothetical protein
LYLSRRSAPAAEPWRAGRLPSRARRAHRVPGHCPHPTHGPDDESRAHHRRPPSRSIAALPRRPGPPPDAGPALSRGATLAVAVDRLPALVLALADNARLFGAEGLETHRADARAFIDRETRRFDVIFLDPPFAEDPWDWLLPACAARLAAGGAIYAEAGRALAPPPGLEVVRAGRAGQVHYHLLAPC